MCSKFLPCAAFYLFTYAVNLKVTVGYPVSELGFRKPVRAVTVCPNYGDGVVQAHPLLRLVCIIVGYGIVYSRHRPPAWGVSYLFFEQCQPRHDAGVPIQGVTALVITG